MSPAYVAFVARTITSSTSTSIPASVPLYPRLRIAEILPSPGRWFSKPTIAHSRPWSYHEVASPFHAASAQSAPHGVPRGYGRLFRVGGGAVRSLPARESSGSRRPAG